MGILLQGSSYSLSLIGDGSATSVSTDLSQIIATDPKVSNKTPVGVFSFGGCDGASIAGNIVTLEWNSARPDGQSIGINLVLSFKP